MRCAHLFCASLLTAMLATAAAADEADEKKKKDDAPKAKPAAGDREEMHRKLLKEFDKDGDGKLNEAERAKARETHQSRRGDRGRRPDGPGPEGRRPEGRRPGPGGPGGPGFMPNPERLFNAFDADKDDKLSREEFGKLVEKLRELRPSHGPDGRRPGPPPEGRRPGRPDGDRPRAREDRPDGEGRRRGGDRSRDENKEEAPKEKSEDADKTTA